MNLQRPNANDSTQSANRSRNGDLMSLTRECAEVTGIPYLMEANREEALRILES